MVAYCATHTRMELWDGLNQTLLASAAWTRPATGEAWQSAGLHQFVQMARTSDENHVVRLIDTSAGTLNIIDEQTLVTPGWGTMDGALESRGSLVSIAMEAVSATPYNAVSLYVYDTETQEISASPPSTLLGQGCSFSRGTGALWIDWNKVLNASWDVTLSNWSVWNVTTPTLTVPPYSHRITLP